MKNDVGRPLDDEHSLEELDGGARGEAAAWERIIEAFREDQPSGALPPWLEERIMVEVRSLPARTRVRRLADWLVRPQPIRVPPLALGLGVAGLAAVVFLPLTDEARTPRLETSETLAESGARTVYVQFSLEAPGATSVAVAGDFSGWNPAYQLSDSDGDGIWTGRIPVQPGVHTYMFVVDGSEWITDPRAERYQDDGFGNRNAVLAVTQTSL